jgi:hypothetical protein
MKRMMILMALAVCSVVYAEVPDKLSYQGVLTGPGGAIVPNGNYNLTLSLYNVPTGGSALWTEGQLVNVTSGVFSVLLGSVTPLRLPFDKPYYLGVAVGGGAELAPRTPLTAAAYSLNAPKMAFGSSGATTALGANWTNYEGDSVTLYCPAPGYVVVQSTVWMNTNHAASEEMYFYLAHDTVATGGGPGFHYYTAHEVPTGAPAYSGVYVTMPVQTVFPIQAAGNKTFFLNGRLITGNSSEYFYYASTIATWYPGTMPPVPTLMNEPPLKIHN